MSVDDIKEAVSDDQYINWFYDACEKGDLDLAKNLYNKGMDLGINIYLSEDGSTIINCLKNGHYDVVKYIITKGSSISSLDVLDEFLRII
jgi:hypothetical protein